MFSVEATSRTVDTYALIRDDRSLAVIPGAGWGRRPVRVLLDGAGRVDPGLVLFAAYVARGLTVDARIARWAVDRGGAAAGGRGHGEQRRLREWCT